MFVDTPGIFTTSKRQLTKSLNKAAEGALQGVDVVLHVVDPTRPIGPEDKKIQSTLEKIDLPKILVINKIDLREARYTPTFEAWKDNYEAVVKLSAKTGQHLKSLIMEIENHLPEGESMYEKGQFTNLDNKFWFAELIREKLFLRLREELPYSLTVKVDQIEDRRDGSMYIKARIITAAERYKGMIVGKGGRGVKEIGQSARKEIEGATNKKAYLDLSVVVDPHWTEEFK